MPDLKDPIQELEAWHSDAVKAGAPMADAISLCTSTPDGKPSARMVLYKGLTAERAILLVTNYGSRKAQDIEANPRVALIFYWPALARQIRVEGSARRCTPEESDAYWKSRPRASNLSAWASPQSQAVASRGELEERVREAADRFKGMDSLPRPEFWGGYKVIPEMIEFWREQPNRLHDRINYHRDASGSWKAERLAP